MSAPAPSAHGGGAAGSSSDLPRRVLIGVALVGLGALLPFAASLLRDGWRKRKARRRSDLFHRPVGWSHRKAAVHAVAPVRDGQLAKKYRSASRQIRDADAATVKPDAPPPTAADVLRLVRDSFPSWRDSKVLKALEDDAFNVRPLTGGSTNTLWLCTLNEAASEALEASEETEAETPGALVVRFYGLSSDTFIERNHEAEVAELLSAEGIGARIFFHFSRPAPGRIEQFIPGRVLRYDELAREDIARPLAQELARLHCTQLAPTQAERQRKGSKVAALPTPVVFENLWKYFKVALTARAAAPHIGSTFDESSASAHDDLFSRDAQNALYARLGLPDVGAALASGEWSLSRIDALDLAGPVDALPSFIRDNKYFKELRWLHELLANWNSLEYAHDTEEEKRNASKKQKASFLSRQVKEAEAAHQRFLRDSVAFSQPGLCHNDLNPGNILYSEAPVPEDPAAEIAAAAAASSSESAAGSSGSSSSSFPSHSHRRHSSGAKFTLIDFEYAAPNLPAYDLANHLCERSLNYATRGWPWFASHHASTFPSQEHMRDKVRFYVEAKAHCMLPPAAVTPSAQAHLYVSTLTAMLASHFLWSLWAIIQSAGVRPSSAAQPSWELQSAVGEDGQRSGSPRPFAIPPLAFLEYAESRLELYDALKALWLAANFVPAEEAYGRPPKWQAMQEANDWKLWLEQLDELHDTMRHTQLQSELRQQQALRAYTRALQQRGKDLPWDAKD